MARLGRGQAFPALVRHGPATELAPAANPPFRTTAALFTILAAWTLLGPLPAQAQKFVPEAPAAVAEIGRAHV